jgi:putative inorganic carbon (HCO3(-)) transporter
MANLASLLNECASTVSWQNSDAPWETTLQGSLVFRLWHNLKDTSARIVQKNKIGSYLQLIGFAFVLILLACLGLPQFANDKEGLAVIVLLGLAARICGALLGGKEKYPATAIDAIIFACLMLNVVATAASHYPKESIHGLLKVFIYTGSYFLFVSCFGSDAGKALKRIYLACAALILPATMVALYGLYQYKIGVQPLATWEDPTLEVQGTRIFSTLGNPNLLAAYLLPLIPVSLSLCLSSLWLRKYLAGLACAGISLIFIAATIFTGSRGGYIGLFAALAAFVFMIFLWLWQEKPKFRPLMITAIVFLPVVFAGLVHFVPSFGQRIASIFAGREHTSNSFRMNVWGASWRMFLDNWWFGIGPGNQTFRLAYGLYMVSGFDALGTYCVPLEIAVETGVAGLALSLILASAVFARAHLAFWQEVTAETRFLIAGVTAAIVGMLAHGLFDTVFYRPQVHLIFWLLLAIIVVLARNSSSSKSKQTK